MYLVFVADDRPEADVVRGMGRDVLLVDESTPKAAAERAYEYQPNRAVAVVAVDLTSVPLPQPTPERTLYENS